MDKEKFSFIKMRYMLPILVILCISTIIPFGSLINAVPKYNNTEIQKYKMKLDQVANEKTPPKKQLEIGIRMFDIVCVNETVPVLKLSANAVSCVTPQTAEKLMERHWGIVKNNELLYEPDYSCAIGWSIRYDDVRPANSTIIKTLRDEIKKFSESALWQPIDISYSDENILFVSLRGAFQSYEISSITTTLEKVNFVSEAEYLSAVCN